jgi:hypothetical protein
MISVPYVFLCSFAPYLCISSSQFDDDNNSMNFKLIKRSLLKLGVGGKSTPRSSPEYPVRRPTGGGGIDPASDKN